MKVVVLHCIFFHSIFSSRAGIGGNYFKPTKPNLTKLTVPTSRNCIYTCLLDYHSLILVPFKQVKNKC